MKKSDYTVDKKVEYIDSNNQTASKDVCKFLVYGQNGSGEKRYLVGNAFLKNYYVMLNYTDSEHQHIGFNGDYWQVVQKPGDPVVPPKPFKPDEEAKGSPLIVILIIAGALLFVAIGVCIYIKKRNEKLQGDLHNETKYSSLAH